MFYSMIRCYGTRIHLVGIGLVILLTKLADGMESPSASLAIDYFCSLFIIPKAMHWAMRSLPLRGVIRCIIQSVRENKLYLLHYTYYDIPLKIR